ncbi:class I SAM-dependent methyltransferase [Halosimplex pelagicum]|uniref:Class I SAM-dependent methyltransferase n=1 Tax=Halosimplex pelagicum TaxID=869886 RepID=A0A7D5PA15_9EURY|nr:class I SAM-dependent methyltransferase [Halosimplex pelagicum]QLH84426.1 class I SAM-dependent methyltransferase [Halosimplex pelagicum]
MTDDESGGDGPSTGSVRATYDRIADHFSKTREYAWPEIEEFLDGRSGSVGLDVGCGNGRHTELLADRCDRALGVDLSREMVATARERSRERGFDYGLAQADASSLPVRDGVADLAVFVATLPHLPTREARIGSLDELARVLAPDGRALVSAWSTEHDRFDADEGFDTTVEWTLPGGEAVDRFYHIYDPEEFRRDVGSSGLELEAFEVSSGNCYGVVRSE